MQYAFMSDKPAKPYDQFILKALSELADLSDGEVQGIALVALTPTATYTSYWNMNYTDKCRAETSIRSDVFDALMLENKDRYSNDECADTDDCY